jgi:hypothetical protein
MVSTYFPFLVVVLVVVVVVEEEEEEEGKKGDYPIDVLLHIMLLYDAKKKNTNKRNRICFVY